MNILEILQNIWSAFLNLLGQYQPLIIIVAAGIVVFLSVRSYRNLRRVRTTIDAMSVNVDRIVNVVDNRMGQFSQDLIDAYRHITDLKEKLQQRGGL